MRYHQPRGMPREIPDYEDREGLQVHPAYTWLLKCSCCGQYRDRDSLFATPYSSACMLCERKQGLIADDSPYHEENLPVRRQARRKPKPKPAPEPAYKPRKEFKPKPVDSDTPEMAQVRRAMHDAQMRKDVMGFLKYSDELRALQQGATAA